MAQTRFGEQACTTVLAKLDSYVDNELLTETNLELLRHFEHCAPCAREAEARQQMRRRLQTAVREIRVPADLESRVRDRLRPPPHTMNWGRSIMAIAAGLALCFTSWVAWQIGQVRRIAAGNQSYVSTLGNGLGALMRVGLSDHLHCAVLRRYPKDPPPAAEVVKDLGARYKDLLPVVQKKVPEGFRLFQAHVCHYRGRQFVHVVYKSSAQLLSLLITAKRSKESFAAENLLPALSGSGIPMYSAGIQQFQLAAFESRDHMVYVISDMTARHNLELMAALAPGLRQFLKLMEG